MVSSIFGSSHKKMIDELALELSNTNWPGSGKAMFNVTLMTSRDNQKYIAKNSSTFNAFPLPYNVTDIFNDNGPQFGGMAKHENKLMDIFVKSEERHELKDQLKSVKWHGSISLILPFEVMIIKSIGDIPILKWSMSMSDPLFTANT